jgi:hypothetical protein
LKILVQKMVKIGDMVHLESIYNQTVEDNGYYN